MNCLDGEFPPNLHQMAGDVAQYLGDVINFEPVIQSDGKVFDNQMSIYDLFFDLNELKSRELSLDYK